MAFINKTKILIRKSDNSIAIFDLDKNITYDDFSSEFKKKFSSELIDGEFSFLNVWFDIDKDDTIYGLINDEKGKLISIKIKDDKINSSTTLKYDYNNFLLKFPYVKNYNDEKHIFYYSLNKNTSKISNLIHIYQKNDTAIKNKIDSVKYNIMTNFTVCWNNNIPSVFYFNKVNGHEELFVSTFDISKLDWSTPLQISSTKKSKIYLSVLKNLDDSYHIAFSENYNNKYYCRYLKGNLKEGSFNLTDSKYISSNVMCLFPTLVKYASSIHLQWIEYHDLYSCTSFDSGETWSSPTKNNRISSSPFLRYEFRSNSNSDDKYTLNTIFGIDDTLDINSILPRKQF